MTEKAVTETGMANSDHTLDSDAEQFLTFIMAEEEYGVDILCVQEIRGWEETTPIPKAPSHIKGVINLRGTVVPIIDLRRCFGMESIEYTPVTVVIVLRVESESGSRTVGIVVDAVSDVYTLSETELRPAPDLGDSVSTEFIRGLVNVNDRMVILLEIDRLLNMDDIPDLSSISSDIEQAK
ncbi:MAG: chemotaxis protein CheW [Cellvibrionaceae bacterium]